MKSLHFSKIADCQFQKLFQKALRLKLLLFSHWHEISNNSFLVRITRNNTTKKKTLPERKPFTWNAPLNRNKNIASKEKTWNLPHLPNPQNLSKKTLILSPSFVARWTSTLILGTTAYRRTANEHDLFESCFDNRGIRSYSCAHWRWRLDRRSCKREPNMDRILRTDVLARIEPHRGLFDNLAPFRRNASRRP